jgi:uncharacterized protein YecE (DUF72 family)
MATRGEIRIGISGWRYDGWRGSFYPDKLPQRSELHYAAERFNSIELNGSFYSLQRPESFQNWYEDTPQDFVFSVKGSRYLTHQLKLKGIETPLANFLSQGVLRLSEKLGPVLWQFAPQMKFDPGRFETFFKLLPHTQQEAADFGRLRSQWLDERSWLDVTKDRPLRHAVEIRHQSFACEEFIALLRKYEIGLVVADTVEWPLLMDITSDFVYCRLHGSEQLYASGYDPEAIDMWAQRVFLWANGHEVSDGRKASSQDAPPMTSRDVFVYFDNDAKVRAPFDAQSLRAAVEAKFQGSAGMKNLFAARIETSEHQPKN